MCNIFVARREQDKKSRPLRFVLSQYFMHVFFEPWWIEKVFNITAEKKVNNDVTQLAIKVK